MSSPPKTLKTFDGLNRSGQRLCWLLDMHGIELDWSDGLPPFVRRLRTDRHLAMDFWALVRSLRRSDTAELSDQQITAMVVSCVCGANTPPWDHDNKAALADFTSMLAASDASIDADANLPDAIAVPERRDLPPMANEWSGAFEDESERPRISECESVAADALAAEPAVDPVIQTPSMHEISQTLSHHLDEALSRLELTSLELKVHLDNLDSRMSRIEPHLEDITTLVSSSLGTSTLNTLKPGASTHRTSSPEVFPETAPTPPPSPPSPIADVNHAVPTVPSDPELSWRDSTSESWSNSTIAGLPDKAKTAWKNRPQWMNRSQWKKSLPTLPPHLLPDLNRRLKQSWLDSRQFVSARWQSIYPHRIAIAASLLVAALAGGAVLATTHRHPAGNGGTLPREIKAKPPATIPAADADVNAVPDNLQPAPTGTEKMNPEKLDVKSTDSGVVAPGIPQTDKQNKDRENDLVAKPTFKWLGDDSDTAPQDDKTKSNNVPKSAVLGEKSSAPAPSAIGIDTSGSPEPVTVSSDVMAANLLSSPSPAYPQVAKLTHQQGPVVVQAVIDKEGRVDSVHIVKGHLVLRRAAAMAVLNWRYKPYLLDGHPVNVATTITVNFSSDGSHESSTDSSN